MQLVAKKFYQTKEFKAINSRWRELLEVSGFEDIESERENLKTYDRRTQNFDQSEDLLNFYLAIDNYLTNTSSIPAKHRQLLELYTKGMYLTDISKKLKRSYSWVKLIIKDYKRLFLYKD